MRRGWERRSRRGRPSTPGEGLVAVDGRHEPGSGRPKHAARDRSWLDGIHGGASIAGVMSVGVDRGDASGDEAGTAPGDRPFRPDVEGLRAVAVLLVVLFHSGVRGCRGLCRGGRVLRDLRVRHHRRPAAGAGPPAGPPSSPSTGGAAVGSSRPPPWSSFATVVWPTGSSASPLTGSPTATDGRWAAVFLANFHFVATGTNYLSSQQPPSPLQNFWSLAVEEQFYLVYPTLFLAVAAPEDPLPSGPPGHRPDRVIVASFAYSVTDSANSPINAYFSPFTRAWELALGALCVAVSTPCPAPPRPRRGPASVGRPRGHPERRLRLRPDRLSGFVGGHPGGRGGARHRRGA